MNKLIAERTIMDEVAISRSIDRISHQILERNEGTQNLAIVGIYTRGVELAKRIRMRIAEIEKIELPFGTVDITLYRDDFRELLTVPQAKGSDIRFDPKGINIVLVDDVLYTGRTVRAAIDVILDFGRPKRIQLAVLVDRGGRELPIAPDFVGKTVQVMADEYIHVMTKEIDGEDKVIIARRNE